MLKRSWPGPLLASLALLLACSCSGPGTGSLNDDFSTGKGGWVAWPLWSDVEVVPEGQGGAPALRWNSEVKKRFTFVAKTELAPSQFPGKAGLLVTIRSNLAGPFMFRVIEEDGSAYQFANSGQPVTPEWQDVVLPFDQFELEDDGKDENGRLDLDQIHEFWILDIAGYYQTDLQGDRSVWVDKVAVVPAFGAAAAALAMGDTQGEVIPSGPRESPMNLKSDPAVIKDGDTYKMWFGGSPEGEGHQFFYGESKDGVNWDIRPEPVLTLGPKGAWDAADLETPTVLKANGLYHMYYCATQEKEKNNRWSPKTALNIGHATSRDGIHWEKDPANPVIRLGNRKRNDWNWAAAAEPTAIYTEKNGKGLFELWYVGGNVIGDQVHFHIGYATSPDGSHFTEYPGNPVIRSNPGEQEGEYVGYFTPEVVKDGNVYMLFYTKETFNNQPIGPVRLTRSLDGVRWDMDARAVVSKAGTNSWRNTGVFGPTVVVDGNTFHMWYTGFAITTRLKFGIGYEQVDRSALR